MSQVQIIWSSTNGGSSLSVPVDHGNNNSSNSLTPQTIYVRHTGINPITGCGLYIRPYTDVYSGALDPTSDFNEIIGWGDAVSSPAWGGFLLNMNAVNSFPLASWPVFAHKDTTDTFGHTFRTSVGNSSPNKITISKNTYDSVGGTDGTIPSGASPNVRFQLQVLIPSNTPGHTGVRLLEQVLVYTFTS